jgi:hypothetical protein
MISPRKSGNIVTYNDDPFEAVNVRRDFGANGGPDDTKAFVDALAAADVVMVPPGIYNIQVGALKLTDGKQLIAINGPQRWRGNRAYPVKLNALGSNAALLTVQAKPGAVGVENIRLVGLHVDGINATGVADGLLLDASAGGGTYIEGLRFEECCFSNFPRYQLRSLRTVFDIEFFRCTFHNALRAADNLVNIECDQPAAAPGQWTFNDCWLAPYTPNKWAIFAGRDTAESSNVISDLRLFGGTVAPYDPGGNNHGVWVYGGLSVFGTHFEGRIVTSLTSVGIRYTGGNGAYLAPSLVSSFGVGVQIGNPNLKTTEAAGCQVFGAVGFNNYASGGKDVQIVDGGNRNGTVLVDTTFWSTSEVILDNLRETTDGVLDELRLLIGYSPGRFMVGGGITLKGPAGYLLFGGQARVSAQFDKASNALANIPGLSVNVAAGQSYDFEAVLFTTSDVSGGVKVAVGGTATATAIVYEAVTLDAAAVKAQTRAAVLGGAVGGITAVVAAQIKIRGTITVNAAGTLTVQFAQNATFATPSSVLVGSLLTVNQRA